MIYQKPKRSERRKMAKKDWKIFKRKNGKVKISFGDFWRSSNY